MWRVVAPDSGALALLGVGQVRVVGVSTGAEGPGHELEGEAPLGRRGPAALQSTACPAPREVTPCLWPKWAL